MVAARVSVPLEGPIEHLRNALQLVKDLRDGPALTHGEADDCLLAIERRLWRAMASLEANAEPWNPLL